MQRLAGPVLDSKYAKTITDVDALLKKQPDVLGTSVFYSHDMCSDIGLEVYVMVWGCF